MQTIFRLKQLTEDTSHLACSLNDPVYLDVIKSMLSEISSLPFVTEFAVSSAIGKDIRKLAKTKLDKVSAADLAVIRQLCLDVESSWKDQLKTEVKLTSTSHSLVCSNDALDLVLEMVCLV